MTKCKECSAQVSTKADKCPQCGAPVPKTSRALIGCATLIGTVVLFGMCMRAVGEKGDGGTSKKIATPVAPAPTQPVAEVTASEILKAYGGNEVKADNAYRDKTLRISGLVDEVKKDITDDVYVTVGTGAAFEIPQVQCMLADGEESKAANLSKGQRVTVQGTVAGLMMNVLVRECQISAN